MVDDTDNCDITVNLDQLDTDGDGLGDVCDPDDDNDGTPDGEDPCPLDPLDGCGCTGSGGDTDGDGICNDFDPDDDNDGIPDGEDPCPFDPANACVGCVAAGGDTDGDGICNDVGPRRRQRRHSRWRRPVPARSAEHLHLPGQRR